MKHQVYLLSGAERKWSSTSITAWNVTDGTTGVAVASIGIIRHPFAVVSVVQDEASPL